MEFSIYLSLVFLCNHHILLVVLAVVLVVVLVAAAVDLGVDSVAVSDPAAVSGEVASGQAGGFRELGYGCSIPVTGNCWFAMAA